MENLNHLNYYRLPWNLTDNSISWLEPTSKCNLHCEGCYRKNENNSHKSLETIKEELDVFKLQRITDGISIAGGEPLLHPQITDIVKLAAEMGFKPIINSNAFALTPELLKELKKAGVYGFTFHIDSKQGRKGWENATELDLNELRYQYASMLRDERNICCSFNSTVYRDTMKYIPDMLDWAHRNIDIVHTMVFILYRMANDINYDYYIGPNKVEVEKLVYNEVKENIKDIKADEVVELIRTKYPDFDPCAYLNGSFVPDSFKWLLTGRLANKKKVFGYMGGKTMEIIQTVHHILFGKYLAYSKPAWLRTGKSMLLIGIFDKNTRKAAKRFYTNPLRLFTRLYYQSVMIIQPVDVLDDGRQNMCDGCPDMTVWNGKLVWSCRLEEQLNYGMNMNTFPKEMTSLKGKNN